MLVDLFLNLPKLISVKKIYLLILVTLFTQLYHAQYSDDSGFRLGIRGGLDVPSLDNNTPFVDYKMGFNIGFSADYYWSWIGLGVDVDYYNNKAKSTFPTNNLYFGNTELKQFSLTENNIKRYFFGIGPNFKHQFNDQFSAIFKLRGGFASLKDGEVSLSTLDASPNFNLNFHNNYNSNNSLSAKAQLEFNYFFTENFGLNFGAYYLEHFKVKEDASFPIVSSYIPVNTTDGNNNLDIVKGNVSRGATEHEAHSYGAFVGLTYQFSSTPKKSKTVNTTYPYQLVITSKDAYTKEVLPYSEVAVYNSQGQRSYYGTTNNKGEITFKNVKPDDYEVKGKFREITLVNTRVERKTLITLIPMKVDIENQDERFIIEGKVTDCNTQKSLKFATVNLKNENNNEIKNLKTKEDGTFTFMATKDEVYSIYGKKGNYFSQTESLDGKTNDRSQKLFINLQVCMEETLCNKAINLKNIHYDLDKSAIRDDAKTELDKLYQFLLDNPMIKLELSSHTDSRGSDAYNLKLSQERADSAVNYLVSKGIDKTRMIAKGYGETMLLNECKNDVNCTDSQHQKNRRTEFKVVCITK